MEILKTYKDIAVIQHPSFDTFRKRFNSAMCREKFLRENKERKMNNTSTSTKLSQYIYETETDPKTIFIKTSNYFFEELLDIIRDIAKKEIQDKLTAEVLIEKLYNSEKLRKLFEYCWNISPWTKSVNQFHDHLIEESFFYFDDLQNQFYFNLFRGIRKLGNKNEDKNEFFGGILHSLIKHFDLFSKFHPDSNDKSKFHYNSFLWKIIDCSINGKIILKDKICKENADYSIPKEITFDDKILRVVLYWESTKQLFYLNTFYIRPSEE